MGVVAAILLAAVGLPSEARADPALWQVQNGKATVYLFGTIHLGRPAAKWNTPAFDRAFSQSQDLYLEVSNLDDTAAMLPLVQSLGTDPAHPLSTKLTKSDLSRVDAAAKAAGLPGEAALEPMRPWLVNILLVTVPMLKAGYDPKSGIDLQLESRAKEAGKPVKGFETLEQQTHFFADLPQAQEIAMLDDTLDTIGKGQAEIQGMYDAWAAGDVERVAKFEDSDSSAAGRALMDTLLVKRNANWAQQIDRRLHGDGVSFVAVGAAHLAGTQSLIADLTKLGYTVKRIQ